ncbi:hypothetical protein LTR53_014090 [Teratosphaeriaceae sp. CCFEE 6253]|nr:hypothetical protein LTR53_014090 [Teratosphaeriaceae sp. CCFEE 6253]
MNHLTTHEQLTDVLLQFVEGLDDNIPSPITSSLTADAILDVTTLHAAGLVPFAIVRGADAVAEAVLRDVGHLDTTHMVTTVRSRVSSAPSGGEDMTSAKVTAYVLAQHWRPGQGVSLDYDRDMLAAVKYTVEMVQRSGEWKIKLLKMDPRWAKGDAGVFSR